MNSHKVTGVSLNIWNVRKRNRERKREEMRGSMSVKSKQLLHCAFPPPKLLDGTCSHTLLMFELPEHVRCEMNIIYKKNRVEPFSYYICWCDDINWIIFIMYGIQNIASKLQHTLKHSQWFLSNIRQLCSDMLRSVRLFSKQHPLHFPAAISLSTALFSAANIVSIFPC